VRIGDHRAPSFSDVSDCRAQASRQADLEYPDRILSTSHPSGEVRYKNPDWSPAEDWFFKLCMQSKGYTLAPTPPRLPQPGVINTAPPKLAPSAS